MKSLLLYRTVQKPDERMLRPPASHTYNDHLRGQPQHHQSAGSAIGERHCVSRLHSGPSVPQQSSSDPNCYLTSLCRSPFLLGELQHHVQQRSLALKNQEQSTVARWARQVGTISPGRNHNHDDSIERKSAGLPTVLGSLKRTKLDHVARGLFVNRIPQNMSSPICRNQQREIPRRSHVARFVPRRILRSLRRRRSTIFLVWLIAGLLSPSVDLAGHASVRP